MKINIKTSNLDLTPAITIYIDDKINSLEKFISGKELKDWDEKNQAAVEADVEIARTTSHHRQGDIFSAEVNLKVPGRIIRAEAKEWDIRVAIDRVKDELQIELKKYKNKQETEFRKGSRLLKKLISISPLAWLGKEKRKGGRDLEEGI
ncbi:ribosomal subunit interface protein [Candidatus Azambacteria bacterium RIFCSPLOWO2_01_FULL_37_9]|uniref:Ribosomal subunit interface protein n=1 Tax=Candidatus Azambacteria bacterium RIFCSPLOWO2_01_FULL_37_9 TaxID=1797297 RepID=A0A1F5C702_9BACT|nr:MAG: ribosomal subunit interface protein [Candidatus Azambacteria bacterium RIFCSPLOWO2_01_FULL_37_9]